MRASARLCEALMVSLVLMVAAPGLAADGWEIEFHAGALSTSNPSNGNTTLPPLGPVIGASLPTLPSGPSRSVSSWFFGDGASTLNQASAGRPNSGIVPLDALLTSRFVTRDSGGSVGIRVARWITSRIGAEIAVDASQGQLELLPGTATRLKSTQASFQSTWNALLAAPSGNSQIVTSDSTVDAKRGTQVVTTGAVLIDLLTKATLRPYIAVGAGYVDARGGAPSIDLTGHYQFTFPPIPTPVSLQINQTDSVKVRSVVENTVTWVVGGGIKYGVGEHWGVSADVRDHVNRDPLRTSLAAAPTTASSGPPGTLSLLFTTSAPVILFGSTPAFPSTLGGTPLDDFRTFTGRGIVHQVNASAGLYFRF